MVSQEYDVIVLGGGTAGSNAAKAAVKAGAHVLLVRHGNMWNTCVEEGCMPSKSILASSHFCPPYSFTETMKIKDGHIDRLKRSLDESLRQGSFDITEGNASFLPQGKGVEVEHNGERITYTGKRYVIATGSAPFVPPVEGIDTLPDEKVLVSSDIVGKEHIDEKLSSIIILGGGPVGLELAIVFAGVGTRVTIVERGELLKNLDPEFGEELAKIIAADERSNVIAPGKMVSVSSGEVGIQAVVETKEGKIEVEGEKLLVATGRHPVLRDLQVEHMGLAAADGKLSYNERTLQTDNPDVYIAGDVTGRYQILHYASHMGKVAGHNAATGTPEKKMEYGKIAMGIIFTHPPIAYVGMTEREAKEKNIDTASSMVRFPSIGRGILEQNEFGLWKLTAERGSGKIVGSQIIGPRADDLIHIIASIMHFGGTVQEAEEMLWYHPTYAEFTQSLARKLCDDLNLVHDDTISPGM